MSGAHILLVDDDRAILRAVGRSLRARDYSVDMADRGANVAAFVRDSRPELVILDLVLPDVDGVQVCREVRGASDVPIIVLSAVGDDRRKVSALDAGADDYLTKPFSMNELLARVRAALRRSSGAAPGGVLNAGPVQVNIDSHRVWVDGVEVHLTPREFDLLRYLVQFHDRVITPRQLLAEVWGPEYVDDAHILRTFVHQLRTKLDAAQQGVGSLIRTDPGVGYQFRE